MVRGDGSRHLFYDTLHEGESSTTSYRYTRDGSYLRMHCTASSGNCVPGLVTQIEIESPDGLVYVFEDDPTDAQTWQRGRLKQIRDRFIDPIDFTFVNTIDFTYGTNTATISDGHRTTMINFDPNHGQVSSVVVPGFNGTTATFDFSYGDAALQGSNPTPVKVLETVTLPDGSAWTMAYKPAPDDPLIERLTLPTGGAYEWDYAQYSFPGTTQLPSGLTLGVIEKRALGTTGAEIGRWEYIQDTTMNLEVATIVRATLELDTMGNPTAQNETKHYFRDQHGGSEPHWAHGLPFTFREDDGTGERYLSREYHEGLIGPSNPPLRTEYVRFTADATTGLGSHLNQRLEKARTVYHTDGDSHIDVTFSGFDGLGNFRTRNRSGLGDPTGRIETVNFNPGSGSHDCTSSTVGITCTGTFTPPSTSSAWILDDYDQATQAENGDTAKQLFCFDQTTGFLERAWTLKSSVRGTTDLVQVLTPDGNGNVARQELFGGDGAGLSTAGEPCTVGLGTPDYRIEHTYRYGTLEQSQYRDPAGGSGPNQELDFFLVDNTTAAGGTGIDQNTGLVKASKDVSGILTTFTYDGLGRLTAAIPANGHGGRIKHIYTPFNPTSGALARVVTQYRNGGNSANLAVERVIFDGLGRIAQEGPNVAGHGAKTRAIAYNGVGWTKSVSNLGFLTNTTEYRDYDPFGRPGRIRPPDGMSHDVIFLRSGVRQVERKVKIELSTGEQYVSSFERYDAQGRLIEVEEPSAPGGGLVKTQYAYDVGNRLRQVTTMPGPQQQVRTFNYDRRGFLTSETHPETGQITYSLYDARGLPSTSSSGGHTRSFTYDGAARLRATHADGKPYKTLTYGTPSDGGQKLGRLLQTVRHNRVDWYGTGIVDLPVTESYTFGGPGGRVSRRDTSIAGIGAFTQAFTYNDLRQISTLDYPCLGTGGNCSAADPASPREITRSYTLGFLTKLSDTSSVPSQDYGTITYHPNAHVHQVNNANGLGLTYCIAANGTPRPSAITLGNTCGTPSLAYAYDGAGNVTQMGGESYHYDKVGRIEHVTTGIPNTQDFDYDAFGNLVAIDTDRQGQLDERDWPVTAKNQLLDADYDASGNLIQYQNESTALALDWDALGTVSRVSSGSIDLTYLYTAQDERVAAKLSSPFGSFVTLTLRDLDGLVLREYLDSVPDELMSDDFETGDLECWSGAVGGPPAGGGCPKIGVTWQRDHIYRNGQLVATELATAPGRIYHYLNHLGTPVLVADATGSVLQGEGDFFFPFGESQELSGHTPLSPLRYTGHLRDENGLPAIWDDLDQMHARYYGPHFGRFMRPDPIIAANLRFPQTWNQYAYAFNSPVTFLDRFGLQAGAYLDEITVTDNPIDAGWPGGIFSLLRLGSRPWGGGGSGRGIDLLYVARDFSAGFGDALLFGFGDELRERTSSDSSVDKCSDLYRRTYLTTSVATLFLGGGRLAYAGAAKGLSYAARARGTTAAVLRASTARDTLKKIFRLGINRTSRIQPANARLTEYGREGLARAIGRTNPTFNSMGALGFVDGAAALLGLEDCE